MKKIYLHIGHGKTGTSSLQSLLAIHHPILRDHHILYPSHRNFADALHYRVSAGNLSARDVDNWMDELVMQAIDAEPGFDSYIFSSESLFWRHHCLGEQIANHNLDAFILKVILCVRNPVDMIVSTYQQDIKRGGYTGSIDQYVAEREYREPHLEHALKVLEDLESLGIDYSLLNYSKESHTINQRITKALEIDTLVTAEFASGRVVNRSLSEAELQLLILVNSIFGPSAGSLLSDELVNQLPSIPSARLCLSEESHALVNANSLPLVQEINRRLPDDEKMELLPHSTPVTDFSFFHRLSPDQISVAQAAFDQWIRARD